MNIELFFDKLICYIKNTCKHSPYSIVSLGPNCYPKTVLTRTGLIKRKRQGQPTMPFDLAWYHSAKYVTEFLETDFDKFLTDLKYSEYSGSWDNGTKINFSHEAYIGPTEKHRLIQVYRHRIKNFRHELRKTKPILFLQILKDEKVGQDCLNTYAILKKLCQKRKFLYVVIDCINILKDTKIPNDNEIYTMTLPFPNGVGTDVFSKTFYESEEGSAFEQDISEFIQNIIINEFQTTPVKYN